MSKIIRVLPEKQLEKRGKSIRVETSHVFLDNVQHVFVVRCSHQDVFHEATLTVGAVEEKDGRPESYDVSQLQNDLDRFRDKHADECAWKHHLQTISESIT